MLQFSKNRSCKDGLQEQCKACNRENYLSKRDLRIAKSKEYNRKNKEKVYAKNKAYRQKNKESVGHQRAMYQKIKRSQINAQQAMYRKKRSDTDISFKIANNLRSRFKQAIKKNFKSGSAVRDLGCSVEYLRKYLESKFQEGMSWENWSIYGWHIDHIKPLSSFDLTDRNQLLEACHYTNLQPLWAVDNWKKRAKMETITIIEPKDH